MGDLLSTEGRKAVRRRQSRDDVVERYRWPLIGAGALGVAVANYIGLVFAGVHTRESLIIAGGLWVLIMLAYVVLGVATRKRVVPQGEQGEQGDTNLDPTVDFETRAEAADEAARRNQRRADTGEYWRPEELGNGRWGLRRRWVAKRGPRRGFIDWLLE